MKQILIELDDETARRLEEVAPARDRRRSAFIRVAVRKALDELQEQRMAEAYRLLPDDPAEVYLDPAVWGPRDAVPKTARPPARRGRKRQRRA